MSSPFFAPVQLPALQQAAAMTRQTAAVIQRNTPVSDGRGGQTANWATLATTTCRIKPPGRNDQRIVGERLVLDNRFTLAFAAGTDITTGDRVQAGGSQFEVNESAAPLTYEIERLVYGTVVK